MSSCHYFIVIWNKNSKNLKIKVFQKPIILIDSCSEFNADQKSSGDQNVIMSLFHCDLEKKFKKSQN